MSSLLLGVGNILLTDEAIGVRVVEEFERRYHSDQLTVLDGGTAGMELLDDIANKDLVLIVDAVKHPSPAGTIVTLYDDEVPKFFNQKISPHQLGLSDLLSALYMIDQSPKKLVVVGIVPQEIEPHVGLTPLIAGQMDTLVAKVLEELQKQSIEVQAKCA